MFGGDLNYFSHKSGLKINLEKSALLGLNCSELEVEVEGLAFEIGCEKEE